MVNQIQAILHEVENQPKRSICTIACNQGVSHMMGGAGMQNMTDPEI